MKNIQIFGVNITKIIEKELFQKIDSFLLSKKQHYITTPNPEFLLRAGEDEEFFYVLNQADINLPDGVGLKFAGWAIGENFTRITGADLVPDILSISRERKLKVGILNWKKGLSESKDIARGLWDKFEGLNFYIQDIDNREIIKEKDSKAMQEYEPDILFVTFGAPFQEKFIFHNLKNLPSVKLAMGVGASFDYITGKTKRAPKIISKIGFEWLWRLLLILTLKNKDGSVQKIKRSKRIYNAVFKFTFKFLKWRFILPYLYRPNVVSLSYKREGDKYKIFIVKRSTSKKEHWQLPQGGIERGESGEEAGVRELHEESGTDKFKPIKFFKNVYKYDFKMGIDESNNNQKHNGYKGQKQSLLIAEFKGSDDDIEIEFWDHDEWMWIDSEKLLDKVFYLRRESTKLFLDKFKEVIKEQ